MNYVEKYNIEIENGMTPDDFNEEVDFCIECIKGDVPPIISNGVCFDRQVIDTANLYLNDVEKEKKEEKAYIDAILKSCTDLIESSNGLLDELKAMDEGKNFLINEYKTNKKYFRPDPGKTTIEDVIKTTFEFAWASRGNYEYDKERKKKK